MEHEGPNRPEELPAGIVKEMILGGGTAAVSSTVVYILAKLSGDNGTLPNYFIPWYSNGAVGEHALPRYTAHAGEIALFVAPVGGLCMQLVMHWLSVQERNARTITTSRW